MIHAVHTNPYHSDSIQAYYAGLMEGVITRKLIADHYDNTVGDYCKDKSTYCDKLRKFLEDNIDYMNGKGKENVIVIGCRMTIITMIEQFIKSNTLARFGTMLA